MPALESCSEVRVLTKSGERGWAEKEKYCILFTLLFISGSLDFSSPAFVSCPFPAVLFNIWAGVRVDEEGFRESILWEKIWKLMGKNGILFCYYENLLIFDGLFLGKIFHHLGTFSSLLVLPLLRQMWQLWTNRLIKELICSPKLEDITVENDFSLSPVGQNSWSVSLLSFAYL